MSAALATRRSTIRDFAPWYPEFRHVAISLKGDPTAWEIREVGDGNLNLVFIVTSGAGGVVVKQARPYVRLVGESWPLPLNRAHFEHEALKIQAAYVPMHVPKVYHFEPEQAATVGDLHTGSVMVTEADTRVIDPEFAFFGPMGFDVGAILANLMLSYVAKGGHSGEPDTMTAYRRWLLDTVEAVWTRFETKFWRSGVNPQPVMHL